MWYGVAQVQRPGNLVYTSRDSDDVCWQVRFLVDQGIDHLVTLSPEKIPPHYAFPNLRHTLIPVEDFTGPTIPEIQKFIEITDDARKEGEVSILS